MAIEKTPIDSTGDKFKSVSTPSTNGTICNAVIGPKFVVPIIFIPGIMGSNVESLGGKKVWFPANGALSGLGSVAYGALFRSARDRQTELDPETTQVSYNGDIKFNKEDKVGISEEVARARGWGSVWWKGYGPGLMFLERYLNHELIEASGLPDFSNNSFKGSEPWKAFTATNESGADASSLTEIWNPAKAFELLDLEGFENLADYAFPVFAEGYNWLQNNKESAEKIATRMNTVVKAQVAKEFPKASFHKFIVVTHSMGGLVGRSLINEPSVSSDILGVVHGVMPASGAPTVYKRLATGWDGFKTTGAVLDAVAKYVFGASAAKLIPVLANSPGGMSLLPFTNFMTTNESNPNTKIKPWLRLVARNLNGDVITATLPKSDPYDEIYSDQTSWWQMVDMGKLDPTGAIRGIDVPEPPLPTTGSVVGLGGVPEAPDPDSLDAENDAELLLSNKLINTIGVVQQFQDSISNSYHANTFAHYGRDPEHLAFNEVVWETEQRIDIQNENDLINYTGIPKSNEESTIDPVTGIQKMPTINAYPWQSRLFEKDGERRILRRGASDVVFKLNIKPNKVTGFGDGTVCHQSAEDVNRESAKQVFVINGYEHSASYGNEEVLKSVLYSVAKLVNQA
ncbi:esterase/lipase family protein [Acinetobacter indicus]|uniref:Alpha/beta hydrolase n=1 Tax=Acinetobacter indicus TaxID=756892 RepID=A0AAW8YZ43_9GAMM|nr:hypothetical protein [Acinetobacter indicus]MCO8089681.1 hypothetical protein [Acinetobacter indicus]MCO8100516.1 hypothetical protein [Acinetobacter indicus]MCO8106081.1 hypothetical protein [Acinetobacter indicus]MCO8111728.1 hypothetical protein [Acinetobacter indicus]MDM1291940.1 hypothetical protein [Acinetobacter indicus]